MPERVKLVIKDTGWIAMIRRYKQMKESYANVGVLADDSKGEEVPAGSDLTVAEIAVVNEFGTKDGRIPSRSFVRSAFDEQRETLAEIGKKLLSSWLVGETTLEKALDLLGSKLSTEIKKKITTGAGVPPPNAPSTIKAKGSSRPLVDEAKMVGAVTWANTIGGKREP
jgi:hypothetical protein